MLHNSNVTPTKQGISFDGYFRDAHICKGVIGRIYAATPRFNDGELITTSEIVEVGFIPAIGHFVETVNGSRYHIATTEYSAAQTGVVKEDMKNKRFYIETNIDYFKPLQWS